MSSRSLKKNSRKPQMCALIYVLVLINLEKYVCLRFGFLRLLRTLFCAPPMNAQWVGPQACRSAVFFYDRVHAPGTQRRGSIRARMWCNRYGLFSGVLCLGLGLGLLLDGFFFCHLPPLATHRPRPLPSCSDKTTKGVSRTPRRPQKPRWPGSESFAWASALPACRPACSLFGCSVPKQSSSALTVRLEIEEPGGQAGTGAPKDKQPPARRKCRGPPDLSANTHGGERGGGV